MHKGLQFVSAAAAAVATCPDCGLKKYGKDMWLTDTHKESDTEMMIMRIVCGYWHLEMECHVRTNVNEGQG